MAQLVRWSRHFEDELILISDVDVDNPIQWPKFPDKNSNKMFDNNSLLLWNLFFFEKKFWLFAPFKAGI